MELLSTLFEEPRIRSTALDISYFTKRRIDGNRGFSKENECMGKLRSSRAIDETSGPATSMDG